MSTLFQAVFVFSIAIGCALSQSLIGGGRGGIGGIRGGIGGIGGGIGGIGGGLGGIGGLGGGIGGVIGGIGGGISGGHSGGGYHEEPAVYSYQYGVSDDYSGVNFGQDEKRDGYVTSGSYRVALPDGRIQHVAYHVADAYSGYVADVTYEGVPTYGRVRAVHAPASPHGGGRGPVQG